jgi:hypothetical protein
MSKHYHVFVTRRGFCVGNWIYWTLTLIHVLDFSLQRLLILLILSSVAVARLRLPAIWVSQLPYWGPYRLATFIANCSNFKWLTNFKSKSRYDRRSVDQSVLVSCPIWGSRPDFCYCKPDAGLPIPDSELLYDWRITTNQFFLAPNPLRDSRPKKKKF